MRSTTVRFKVTTQPSVEPVTLAELKAHLRITATAEDSYLSALLVVAREWGELWTKRAFILQTITAYRDTYPSGGMPWWEGIRLGTPNQFMARIMELPRPPLIALASLTVYDSADVATLVDPASYIVDTSDQDMPGRIALRNVGTWPVATREVNAIRAIYTAGYGPAAADVPAGIRQGILILAAYLYANRGDCADVSGCAAMCGATTLLSSYRILDLG